VTAVRHLLAILVLPAVVTIAVPVMILRAGGSVRPGGSLPPPLAVAAAVTGAVFVGLGLLLMVRTISLFATVGKGTLAPWDPPRRLVVHGVYRHVRNPMISGVLSILLGEALALGSVRLFGWFLLFLLINAVYIPLLEEPMLVGRFGEDYVAYRRNVPRWIPRLQPWDG
jgi:protein-S-isoprenylcysteine O-methyltransferase Ste14